MTRTASNRSFARPVLTIATIAAVAGLAAPASAQRFQRLDGTKANETSFDIEQTRDAGYVTAGYVETIDPANGVVDEDFYVMKHRKDGTVEWTTRYGGPNRDRATSIHQTADGGYIVAGHTESAGPGNGLGLLRLDPFGNPIWAYAYQAGSYERLINPVETNYYLQPAVRESAETGEFIVVTNVRNAVGGQHPVYVRTDPNGFPITNVSYIDTFQQEATFAGFTDLKELKDGSIAISGFWSLADPGDPNGIPFVLETDVLGLRILPSGAPIWANRYDDAPFARSFEAGHGIDVANDDSRFTVGAIETRTDPATGVVFMTGTQHLELDAATGAPLAAHLLHDMTPAYAATRYTKELATITAGIDISGFGPAIGVGPGSAVLLKPTLASVANYMMYGPASDREKLEAAAVTNLTCGFAFTGPKTLTLGLGGSDQFLVKTNDDMESGCFEARLDPKEETPEIQPIPVEFVPQFHDNWSQWGTELPWQVGQSVLCFSNRCRPCPADINGDGILDNGDLNAFVALFLGGNLAADFNGDGILDNGDIAAFIAAFLAGC